MVSRDDCGPMMRSYLKKMKLLKKPKLELISSHFGHQILVSCNLCAFYLSIGAIVKNITLIIQYKISKALRGMVETACEMRYRATSSMVPDDKALGNVMKAAVVSCYGKMGANPLKITSVRYLDSNSLLKAIYKEQFTTVEYVTSLDGIDDHLYELRKRPSTVHYCSPVQCSSYILNSAKLRVLKLVYEVLEPCFDPHSFSYFNSNTDSVGIICAERSLEEWFERRIKPEMKEKFAALRNEYFVLAGNSDEARRSFFKAGIWKQEYIGQIAFGLSSKIYSVFRFEDKEEKLVKLSCRSVPHNCIKNIRALDFFKVLHYHEPVTVCYESFNFILGDMYHEKNFKCAITPYYIKRVVLPDFTTKTLDL